MSIEETFEDWKKQSNDPLGYWLSKLNDNHKKLLDEIKKRFDWEINEFSISKREEIQIKLDVHISYRAQQELLERYHASIVNKESFIFHYRNILNGNNLINEEMYHEFIMSFQVIGIGSQWVLEENEIIAMDFLKDIATLNIIESLREWVVADETNGVKRFKEVPDWQRVLKKFVNRFEYDKPTAKFTIIYRWMFDKKHLSTPTQTEFIRHVKKNYNHLLKNKKKDKTLAFNKLNNITSSSKAYTENVSMLNEIYQSK